MSFEKLKEYIDNNLCTRCGTCIGICPKHILDLDDRNYPQILDSSKCKGCDLCVKVCPAEDVNFPELTKQLFGKSSGINDSRGIFKRVFVGHASNSKVRNSASSGGVVTQLLIYLLETGKIDGAIVVTADSEIPWQAQAVLVKTKEELLKSAQSKYTIVPVNKILKEVKQEKGRFVLVGLPCQIHAFRKLENIDRRWTNRIPLVIGLFCHMSLEPEAILSLVRCSGISLDEVKRLEYREGEWPGDIRAWLKNGQSKVLHYGNYLDALKYLQRLYFPIRCLYCIDASSELADLSVADPWIKDSDGDWMFKGGWTAILQRTKSGMNFLEQAQKDGAIYLREIPKEVVSKMHTAMVSDKRKYGCIRILKLKKKGKLFPDYHLTLPEVRFRDKLGERFRSFGMIFGRTEITRRLGTAIAFSWVGIVFIKLKRFWKSR